MTGEIVQFPRQPGPALEALEAAREREAAARRAANAEFRADRARRNALIQSRETPAPDDAPRAVYCFLCAAYCSAPQHAANEERLARKRKPKERIE